MPFFFSSVVFRYDLILRAFRIYRLPNVGKWFIDLNLMGESNFGLRISKKSHIARLASERSLRIVPPHRLGVIQQDVAGLQLLIQQYCNRQKRSKGPKAKVSIRDFTLLYCSTA